MGKNGVKRLLIVEDDRPIAELLKHHFTAAGFTVTATPVLTLTETATPSANRVVFVSVTGSCSGYSLTSPPAVSISAPPCAINGTTCVQATATASGTTT